MIQRVQSIYWFLAAALLIAFLFLPLFGYGPTGYENAFMVQDCTALSITLGFTAAICLLNIFLFNNRPLQIKISWLITALLALSIFVFMGVHYYYLLQGEAPAEQGDLVTINWPVVLPVIALVLNYLAKRGAAADQKLVSASDRLR